LKAEIDQLKRLEEDCVSIQKSLAIIQSAQRILALYTADERKQLFREYDGLKRGVRTPEGNIAQAFDALMIFRQDHADLATIGDVLEQLDGIDLEKLKLQI
jgi:hypothetical protein